MTKVNSTQSVSALGSQTSESIVHSIRCFERNSTRTQLGPLVVEFRPQQLLRYQLDEEIWQANEGPTTLHNHSYSPSDPFDPPAPPRSSIDCTESHSRTGKHRYAVTLCEQRTLNTSVSASSETVRSFQRAQPILPARGKHRSNTSNRSTRPLSLERPEPRTVSASTSQRYSERARLSPAHVSFILAHTINQRLKVTTLLDLTQQQQ